MSNLYGLKRNGSPYTDEECEEIISKLEQLLDGELDADKQKAVEEMVHECEYCLEQYQIEKSMRKLIKEGMRSVMPGNGLIEGIKNRIRSLRSVTG